MNNLYKKVFKYQQKLVLKCEFYLKAKNVFHLANEMIEIKFAL